ncbi:hypothetical protein LUZ60_002772 [Juncus effusus]|nr:hypothetical protein LUZ60_002772 [Juncus effusus]
MGSNSNLLKIECEKDCREINASWNKLSHLGRVLACRTRTERRQIKESYRSMFGEDLVQKIQEAYMSNPKNEMCNMLYMWMLEPSERDAMLVRYAVEKSSIDYKALLEIYTRKKSDSLFFTKQTYFAKFKRNLDQDICTEPSHPFQKILVALATSNWSHNDGVSQHIAKCDAKRFYEAGKGSMINESVILEIISKRSIPQLRLAFTSYKHIYGRDFTKTLKGSCGEFEESLKLAVKCIYTPSEYYSKILHKCMKGACVDKRVLSRVILGSEDFSMGEVKQQYEKKYGIKLENAISDSLPQSDFTEFIVALISYN